LRSTILEDDNKTVILSKLREKYFFLLVSQTTQILEGHMEAAMFHFCNLLFVHSSPLLLNSRFFKGKLIFECSHFISVHLII
jgi:hypothetical protein